MRYVKYVRVLHNFVIIKNGLVNNLFDNGTGLVLKSSFGWANITHARIDGGSADERERVYDET